VEIIEDILDVVSNLDLISVGKDSKIDVSAVRIDHRNARYGLVNCDNFSLQLIYQENEVKSHARPGVAHAPSAASSDEQEPGSPKHLVRPILKNTRIGSYFSFESPDVSDSGLFHTEAVHVHFLNGRSKTLSVYDGAWDINIAVKATDIEIRANPLAILMDDDKQSEETLKRIRDWLPTSIRRLPLYKNNRAYCALVKLKLGIFFDVGSSVFRFSESGFSGVWAVVLLKEADDLSQLFFRDELHIIAVGK